MKTVLVTGGNGFIGRYVVETLLERGYDTWVLDTKWRRQVEGAHLILGDVRDATSVTEAVSHSDGVIHLGGILGTQETIANPLPAAETNILGGLNVLQAVAAADVPATFISVGNHWMNNTYSITKSTIERFADMMNRFRQTNVTVVRGLNAYGPRQLAAAPFGPSRVRKVMPSFICRALSGESIEIYGDGEQIMDMIYVSDLANVLVTALEVTEKSGPVYPLPEGGSGYPSTVNEIAEEVARAVEPILGRLPNITHLQMRPGEDPGSVVLGHPETLKPLGLDATGFVNLSEGVRRTVDFYAGYLESRRPVGVEA